MSCKMAPNSGVGRTGKHFCRTASAVSRYLDDTRGYQALWPILGIPVLLVIPLVWRLSAAERNAGPGEPESPEPIT